MVLKGFQSRLIRTSANVSLAMNPVVVLMDFHPTPCIDGAFHSSAEPAGPLAANPSNVLIASTRCRGLAAGSDMI